MIDQRFIYTRADGGVSIVIPAIERAPGESDAAYLVRLGVPGDVAAQLVDASAVPGERMFRNAWRQAGQAITTDLPAARLIAHDRRRAARAREFAPLDVEATIPALASQAEAARQVIRDRYAGIQTNIDQAATEADLVALVRSFEGA